MNPDAKEVWVGWYNRNVQKIRALEKGSILIPIYQKLIGQCARIAIVIQGMKWGYNLDSKRYISISSMESAIQIAEYFRATSKLAHNAMVKKDPQIERAGDLYQELKSVRKVAHAMKVSNATIQRWKTANPELFF